MIVKCRTGAHIVVCECAWAPAGGGVYLAVGNVKSSLGAIVDPAALDRVRAELDRLAVQLAARGAAKPQRKRHGKAV